MRWYFGSSRSFVTGGPSSGELRRSPKLKIGYFAQHQVEMLRHDESPLWHLVRIAPTTREQELRNFLGGFNFPGNMVTSKIAPFSGGEKARLALALIVIYTGPNAFLSPVALVVVAAIGLAALLLQVWFRRDLPNIHPPLWLNVLGILCAMVSLFADYLRMTRRMLDLVAFAAVVCFGISGSLILHALRRRVRTH